MALIRAVIFALLLASSDAMFKRDMKSVMEEEFPDLGDLGNSISKAAEEAKKIVGQGQDAVAGLKNMALDTFEAAAAQVNQSLKVVGDEIKKLNSTAMREIGTIDIKVKMAKNKVAAFAEGAEEVLQQIQPLFDQFLQKLKDVNTMATQVLQSLNQEKALKTLDSAMEIVMATASSWKSATQDLSEELQKASRSLAGAARNSTQSSAKPLSDNSTKNATQVAPEGTPIETEAPSLLQTDPADELSKALTSPMKTLKSAAEKLNDMAGETTDAMNKFVDAAIEAAEDKVPGFLMDNVTEILKGVKAEATQELKPLGDVGNQIVDGLYKASDDAGLHLHWSSAVRSWGTCTLAMLVLAFVN